MFGRAGRRFGFTFTLAIAGLLSVLPANSNVVKNDKAVTGVDAPIYRWNDTSKPTRAIAIAVHGVTMHGGVFNIMASKLASSGVVVYAPDLRGYGRWMKTSSDSAASKGSPIDYESSYHDLQSIVRFAKAEHPNVPLFCIGESLGADLSLRAAVEMPNALDGIILSNPAVKLHSFTMSKIENAIPIMMNPRKQIDLTKFFRKFASEDAQIVEGALSDPLVRKHMSAIELYHSVSTCKTALNYASKLPKDVSVLVIQGTQDQIVQPKATRKLASKLKTCDQTVRFLKDRGHLLLETDYVQDETMEAVETWINERVQTQELSGLTPVENDVRIARTN